MWRASTRNPGHMQEAGKEKKRKGQKKKKNKNKKRKSTKGNKALRGIMRSASAQGRRRLDQHPTRTRTYCIVFCRRRLLLVGVRSLFALRRAQPYPRCDVYKGRVKPTHTRALVAPTALVAPHPPHPSRRGACRRTPGGTTPPAGSRPRRATP